MKGAKLLFLVTCCINFKFKVESCPEACLCYNEPKISISCPQQRLTAIPVYIPIQTQRIFLNNNKITLVRSTSFTYCQNLTILWIHSNNISHIESGAFHGLNKLEELDMSDNFNLKTISPLTFRGLVHLHTLHLNRCGLQELPPGIFQGLFSLQYLYIHDNNLHYLHDDTFLDLGNLTFLFLHGNKLHSLSENVFSGLTNLDRLLVHQNRLDMIHDRTFHDLKKVTTLFLFNNNMTVLKGEVLAPLVSLQYFRLNGNQWICDCRAKSLWNWLKQFKGSSSEAECYLPTNLAGTDLKKLQSSDLNGCIDFSIMRTGILGSKTRSGKQTISEASFNTDDITEECCESATDKSLISGTNPKTGPSSHTSRLSPNNPIKDKENISKTKNVPIADNRKNRTYKQINDSPFGTFSSKLDSSLTKLKQNDFDSVESSTVPNKKKQACSKKVKSKSQCRMYQPGTNSALLINANLFFITLFLILPIQF